MMANTTLNLSVIEKRIFNPALIPQYQHHPPAICVKPRSAEQWVGGKLSNRWRDADGMA